MFARIAVIGIGLIGGSFALAIKRAVPGTRIVACDRSRAAMEQALALGIADEIEDDMMVAVAGADLVVLAAPVAQTAAVLETIVPVLPSHALITDAGSTKSDVVAAARQALGSCINRFIPGHPIAGREQNGPGAALPDLFRGKKVVLTPLQENRPEHVEAVKAAWVACGAVVHLMSPERHDTTFASVSHLPHVLAYALVDDIARKPHAASLFDYAASGFRDFTRIAGSSPEMWRDIAIANRTAILRELDSYTQRLDVLRQALAAADAATLEAIFHNAQQARQAWARTIESAERPTGAGL